MLLQRPRGGEGFACVFAILATARSLQGLYWRKEWGTPEWKVDPISSISDFLKLNVSLSVGFGLLVESGHWFEGENEVS